MPWYRTLYKGLFDKHPRATIKTPQILISYTKQGRFFSLFPTLNALKNFLETIPEDKQSFFEIILGEQKQKPHFDIDDIAIENVQLMFDSFVDMFKRLGIDANELRWYSSSNEIKQSYHLVLPNFYFETNFDAKRLYYYAQEHLPTSVAQHVDILVYSTLQNFRLLGSQKEGSGRVKRLMPSWNYRGTEIKQSGELVASLISYIPEDSQEFPNFEIKSPDERLFSSPTIVDNESVSAYDQVINEYLGGAFQFDNIKNNVMFYRRLSIQEENLLYHHCYRAKKYSKEKYRVIQFNLEPALGLDDFDQASPFGPVEPIKDKLHDARNATKVPLIREIETVIDQLDSDGEADEVEELQPIKHKLFHAKNATVVSLKSALESSEKKNSKPVKEKKNYITRSTKIPRPW